MCSKYIMAIDQGTTSSRAILVNHAGEIMGMGQEEFPQIYPQSGWVEHDANLIWNNVQSVIAKAFIDSQIEPSQIEAVGITNQRETTVIWDRVTGQPIYHAIVWQSRQSADIAESLRKQGYAELIRKKTGLPIDAYFSATKIRWILDHVPGAQERAERGELCFGTMDTWLLSKLTAGKVHRTDYTNAARTMLFNIHTLEWDEEILDLLNIPRSLLPEVRSNSEIYGYTETYHFYGQHIPIAGMAGDQQASLFGHLCHQTGMVKNTYGTGSFLMMNTGQTAQSSEHDLITTIGYVLGDEVTYALEGSIFITGAGVQWLRDGLALFEASNQTEEMAQRASEMSEVYIVPAFTGLGAPYWNADVRGSIYGLGRESGPDEFAKAMLEAIAYQSLDVLQVMEADTDIQIHSMRVDGGASMNQYLMQFQADIANLDIIRSPRQETTALGAAYLAGLAVGYWSDLASLYTLTEDGKKYSSKMDDKMRTKKYLGWKNAVQATLAYTAGQRKDN